LEFGKSLFNASKNIKDTILKEKISTFSILRHGDSKYGESGEILMHT